MGKDGDEMGRILGCNDALIQCIVMYACP